MVADATPIWISQMMEIFIFRTSSRLLARVVRSELEMQPECARAGNSPDGRARERERAWRVALHWTDHDRRR